MPRETKTVDKLVRSLAKVLRDQQLAKRDRDMIGAVVNELNTMKTRNKAVNQDDVREVAHFILEVILKLVEPTLAKDQLIEALASTDAPTPTVTLDSKIQALRHLLGRGKGVWSGDAQTYVNQLRHDRPL